MRVTRKTHWQIRLQSSLFTLAFLTIVGLLAVLSVRYNYQADWTFSGRNSLSPASRALLDRLEGPVTIISFAQSVPVKRQVTELVSPYHRYKPDLELKFINPDTHPNKVRELGVAFETELVIKKGSRRENLNELSEAGLTNALNRVSRSTEARIVFLTGHGERDPLGQANFDLRHFTQQLEEKGFHVGSLNLSTQPRIPDDTQILAIASPRADLLAGEVELIQNYIKDGGNLLWLAEPGPLHGLKPLAEDLAIEFLPGTIIDPSAQLLLGRGSATFALVSQYGSHPITTHLNLATLFPQAVALKETIGKGGWQQEAILTTLSRTWLETSNLMGELEFNEGEDTLGPLNIGFALSRERPTPKQEAADTQDTAEKERAPDSRSQRVVIIGDGDFLSNTYLGNGGNLDLGFNIVNWLAYEDHLIAIPARTRIDSTLELSLSALWSIRAVFLFALPAILLGTGVIVWWKRRRR